MINVRHIAAMLKKRIDLLLWEICRDFEIKCYLSLNSQNSIKFYNFIFKINFKKNFSNTVCLLFVKMKRTYPLRYCCNHLLYINTKITSLRFEILHNLLLKIYHRYLLSFFHNDFFYSKLYHNL